MSRGVLYIVWGDGVEAQLQRSIRSLKELHPELPHEVVRLPTESEKHKGLLEKSRMMELAPFDETLFLDADTVVLDRLDFGFAQARKFGLACCINENPWARRYRRLPKDDGIEYNTGVMFFTRKAEPLFRRWRELALEMSSEINFEENGEVKVMAHNDQGSFARAVAELEFVPFVLPLNWNFRPQFYWSFFGPIKIWHGYQDPPEAFREMNAYYRKPTAVIQLHVRGNPG